MHPQQQCPARDATCHRCSKKGDFKSVCQSKAVDDISDNNFDITSSTGELSFFDTVSSEVSIVHGGSQSWTVLLGLNSSQTEFKTDTGADVTVVPEHVYNKSRDGPLSFSDIILRGPSKRSLQILGKFLATLKKDRSKKQEKIYVARELQKALLGRPAIESLGLLIRIAKCCQVRQLLFPNFLISSQA